MMQGLRTTLTSGTLHFIGTDRFWYLPALQGDADPADSMRRYGMNKP
tara:strand:- start:359 stop:499 length:141 start_codon:yes stop_codon:yes gene_type:complete